MKFKKVYFGTIHINNTGDIQTLNQWNWYKRQTPTPSSTILCRQEGGDAPTTGSSSHRFIITLAFASHTLWNIHPLAQRSMTGKWAPRPLAFSEITAHLVSELTRRNDLNIAMVTMAMAC